MGRGMRASSATGQWKGVLLEQGWTMLARTGGAEGKVASDLQEAGLRGGEEDNDWKKAGSAHLLARAGGSGEKNKRQEGNKSQGLFH